jgi:hypothetical protein
MYLFPFQALFLCILSGVASGYVVQPFKISLESGVIRMKMLIQQTRLPETSILGNSGRGTELSWLRDRQKDWLERFDWVKEQKEMNR